MKIRKIGKSLGIPLPKEPAAHLNTGEDNALLFAKSPGDGSLAASGSDDFAHQMALVENIARRYRNALKELAR
jgi:putative addiction module antidote